MDYTEITKNKNLIYDGKILQLYNDDVITCDGNITTREYVNHQGGASILAIDDANNIYLVEQYRYSYKRLILELPAGKLERGEDPLSCARRELKEEIGATCKTIEEFMVIYPSPGYTNEPLYVFLAKGLEFGKNKLDKGEFLNVIKMPYKKALELVLKNEIKDSKTVAGVLKYALVENKLN